MNLIFKFEINRTIFRKENESSIPSITKAERDQEIQKYYRADLIQHLTDWSSTQLEKQVYRTKKKNE